jgi:hypothetical protein
MTGNAPRGLGDQAFLIAYDVPKSKLASSSHRVHLVRAAILAELLLHGQLQDQNGTKAHATGARTGDPILDAVLDQIAASAKPRSWQHWVTDKAGRSYSATRDRLADRRVISAAEGRVLGLFPKWQVSVPDTRVVQRLITETRHSALDGIQIDRIDPGCAALAGLAAAIELNTVFSGRERRQHRERIKELAGTIEPVADALRATFVESQS